MDDVRWKMDDLLLNCFIVDGQIGNSSW